MSLSNEREWRNIIDRFKEKFPTPGIKLLVKRKHRPVFGGEYVRGYCVESDNQKHHTIVVDSSQPWDGQLDTLQHEFAHHLWFAEKDTAFWHDKRFWEFHGKIYAEFFSDGV